MGECDRCGVVLHRGESADAMVCECGFELRRVRVDLQIFGTWESEGLWARPLGDDLFELRSIPFFAYGLSYRDVVLAPRRRADDVPRVQAVARSGGHTTLRVVFEDREARAQVLRGLPVGASYELADERYYAVDAASEAVYETLLDLLQPLARRGALKYETARARPEAPARFDAPWNDLLGLELVTLERTPGGGGAGPQGDPPASLDDALWSRLGWSPREARTRRLRLRFRSAEEIRSASRGRIWLPRTLAPESLRPHPHGLFCPDVFGPPLADGREGLVATYGDGQRSETLEATGWLGRAGHVELPATLAHPWSEGVALTALPVLPPGLRPVIVMEDGAVASHDVNVLYLLLLDRLGGPPDIDALRPLVDALFDNERSSAPFARRGGRPLASLSAMLGRDPRQALSALDELLVHDPRALEKPLPRALFRVTRVLEACGLAVEVAPAQP